MTGNTGADLRGNDRNMEGGLRGNNCENMGGGLRGKNSREYGGRSDG